MNKPNIIFMIWHDLGDWLGCYGHGDVDSPCLDRLAKQGALFENYFCTASQCSPSRSSIVTGRMPHSTGVLGLIHRGYDMDRSQVPMPQVLRNAGYSTRLIGVEHECRDPYWEGYDVVQADLEDAASVATRAVTFLNEQAPNSAQPFFLSVGLDDVHRPYGNDFDPKKAETISLPDYLPDCDEARMDMAVFCKRIEKADHHMGRILDALDATGLAEDTLVIFTTDHGAGIPRSKATLYDQGIKTTLIMRWPGIIKPGSRYCELLSNIDLFPTIADFINIEIPLAPQGRSFKTLLTDEAYFPRDEIFAEMSMGRFLRAIRTPRYKYIFNFTPGVPMGVEGGAIARYGAEIIEQHFAVPLPEEELFDLETDPPELNNLAYNEDFKALRQGLHDRLFDWLQKTDDPILKGPIINPEPENAGKESWIQENGQFKISRTEGWTHCRP